MCTQHLAARLHLYTGCLRNTLKSVSVCLMRVGKSCSHAVKRSSLLQAAWLALMYADMPGVSPVRAAMARCLAKQNVDWILGANDVSVGDVQGFSFQVGFNGTSCVSATSREVSQGLVALHQYDFTCATFGSVHSVLVR